MEMEIGSVIRRRRAEMGITQEEMADRLGVTASAVNKWENGKCLPDIALLKPIARLLGVTTDALLSFRTEPSPEEIAAIVREMDAMFGEKPYAEVFAWAKSKLENYPNSAELAWQLAAVLDARRLAPQEIPDADAYDEPIRALYTRALEEGGERARRAAADSLYSFYMRKRNYGEAEAMLDYFSDENPEKKRRRAQIFAETGRAQEAYRALEELLFAEYQVAAATLSNLSMLVMKQGDPVRARMFAQKQSELARCFEMGRYYEACCLLEPALAENDAGAVIEITRELLENASDLHSFARAPLYADVPFKEVREEVAQSVRKGLLAAFRSDDFAFLRDNPRWRALLDESNANGSA